MPGFIQTPFQIKGDKYCCLPGKKRTLIIPEIDPFDPDNRQPVELADGVWQLCRVDQSDQISGDIGWVYLGVCCGAASISLVFTITVQIDESSGNEYVDYYIMENVMVGNRTTIHTSGVTTETINISNLKAQGIINPCGNPFTVIAACDLFSGTASSFAKIDVQIVIN